MTIELYMRFENGMPKGTAQEKGETIKYRRNKDGKLVPYIKHYQRGNVKAASTLFGYQLKKYAPKKPIEGPVRLTMIFYFDIKSPKKLWGTYKTTRPDVENFYKEIADVMTSCGYWCDDSQVVDLRLTKYYAEKATIYIKVEELDNEQ